MSREQQGYFTTNFCVCQAFFEKKYIFFEIVLFFIKLYDIIFYRNKFFVEV